MKEKVQLIFDKKSEEILSRKKSQTEILVYQVLKIGVRSKDHLKPIENCLLIR